MGKKKVLENFILPIEFYRAVQQLTAKILFSIILPRFSEHFSRTLLVSALLNSITSLRERFKCQA